MLVFAKYFENGHRSDSSRLHGIRFEIDVFFLLLWFFFFFSFENFLSSALSELVKSPVPEDPTDVYNNDDACTRGRVARYAQIDFRRRIRSVRKYSFRTRLRPKIVSFSQVHISIPSTAMYDTVARARTPISSSCATTVRRCKSHSRVLSTRLSPSPSLDFVAYAASDLDGQRGGFDGPITNTIVLTSTTAVANGVVGVRGESASSAPNRERRFSRVEHPGGASNRVFRSAYGRGRVVW